MKAIYIFINICWQNMKLPLSGTICQTSKTLSIVTSIKIKIIIFGLKKQKGSFRICILKSQRNHIVSILCAVKHSTIQKFYKLFINRWFISMFYQKDKGNCCRLTFRRQINPYLMQRNKYCEVKWADIIINTFYSSILLNL